MKVIDHISYRKENGFRGLGDLYLPDTVTPETGAALLIHGGGWSALDKSSFAGVALWLCQELGMAAYNINYRLCGQTPWPVCGDDCLEAGDFFLNSAIPEFQGFDRSRIVVIGASAGGHLALMTGLRNGLRESFRFLASRTWGWISGRIPAAMNACSVTCRRGKS